ncbi:MAG TPA: hypothetical protein VMX33_02035 [bacterium]|nr:hypothetical protein [bacterium]
MRRFAVTLILLVVLGGAIFMIGWLPVRIKPGSYAVIVTKTGGVDPAVMAPGSFRWSAAAFLPTNMRLIAFAPASAERHVELSGELPSAAAYSAFMAGEPDFSYAITLRLIASPKPAALPELFSRWGIADDAALSAWLDAELDLAATELRGAVSGAAGGPTSIDGPSLVALVSSRRPLLDVRDVEVLSSRVPDMDLYNDARRLYASYIERFRASVEPALAAASSKSATEQVQIDVLKRYGELLERYPALVDYLSIQAGLPPRAAGR